MREEIPTKNDISRCFEKFKKQKSLDSLFILWVEHWITQGLGEYFQPVIRDEYEKIRFRKLIPLEEELKTMGEKLKLKNFVKRTKSLPDIKNVW